MPGRLNVVLPADPEPVPAGGRGLIVLEVAPGYLEVAGKVAVRILDASGREAWSGRAESRDNAASFEVAWPAEPGAYTLVATAYGLVQGLIATATRSFTVA